MGGKQASKIAIRFQEFSIWIEDAWEFKFSHTLEVATKWDIQGGFIKWEANTT